MNIDRYGKLLRMAADEAAAPTEKATAARLVAKMEAAHPGIRALYIQQEVNRASGDKHAHAPEPAQSGAWNFDEVLKNIMGQAGQVASVAASTAEFLANAQAQFEEGAPREEWHDEDTDEETLDYGSVHWRTASFDEHVVFQGELLEAEDEAGDLLVGELTMPLGLPTARACPEPTRRPPSSCATCLSSATKKTRP